MSEVSCQNCQAACCKGPETMELTREEAAFMEQGGNVLFALEEPADYRREEVIYPVGIDIAKSTVLTMPGHETAPLEAGLGRYFLLSDCVYLETTPEGWARCSVYEERPAVCRDFEEGGDKCKIMRVAAGINEFEDFPDLLKMLEEAQSPQQPE